GFVVDSPGSVTVTITDNDTVAPTNNPIDDPSFFIRQQYLDFLNREPDPGGLAFWISKITSCGTNATCINQQRVGASAAFFRSPEFQETGGFVIRVYKAALNRQPAYLEFVRDRGKIPVAANLEPGKQAFADLFVTRPEFTSTYPGFITAAQYVDALDSNTGNSLTQAQRDALVNGLLNNTETRSTVLKQVADNAVFRQ